MTGGASVKAWEQKGHTYYSKYSNWHKHLMSSRAVAPAGGPAIASARADAPSVRELIPPSSWLTRRVHDGVKAKLVDDALRTQVGPGPASDVEPLRRKV